MPTKPFNAPEMRRIRRIHFVGIGGSGMSGIAEVLSTLGYNISGSDCSDSAVVAHLRSVGCEVSIGHAFTVDAIDRGLDATVEAYRKELESGHQLRQAAR